MARPEAITTLEGAQEYRTQAVGFLRSAQRADALGYLEVLRGDPLYQQAQGLVIVNRWEKLAQKNPEFLKETWGEMGNYFSAGCNNGIKARLWIEIAQTTRPGTYISLDDLYDRYKNIFARTQLVETAREYAKKNMVGYCQDSLYSAGLVAEEVNREGKIIGFGITEDGQKNLDAAYLTLWWENQNNQSLHAVLGRTGSAYDTQSPLSRIRILDYLMRHPHQVREVDLVSNLQLHRHSIMQSLKLFDILGLAKYKRVDLHTVKTPLQYELTEGKDLDKAGYFTNSRYELQDETAKAIRQQTTRFPRFSIADIIDSLPDDLRRRWKDTVLRHQVSGILSSFAKEGYLLRVDNFKGGERMSDASITRKGRSLVLSFIWPVLSIVERRFLTAEQRSWIDLARGKLDDFAQTSAELYYPHSNSAKMRARKEHQARVKELLLARGPMTAGELAEIIGVSDVTVRDYLESHIQGTNKAVIGIGGQDIPVEVNRVKGIRYYSIKRG